MGYWTIFCVSGSETLFSVSVGYFEWVGWWWHIILGGWGCMTHYFGCVGVGGALFWVGGGG